MRYLVLFNYSYCGKICDKIKSQKSGIADGINQILE